MSNMTDRKERPAISVCMASYNGERFIKEQIDSVLAQLMDHDELIVIDDASTDATVDLLESFRDPRIKFYKNDANVGVVATFERAIARAAGEIIFLCDQDDIWHPDKVEIMSSALHGNYVAVVSDCELVDEQGVVFAPSFRSLRGSRGGIIWNLFRNGYLGCAMCFRASLREVILPFPRGIAMHDEWIGLVSDGVAEVAFLDRPLFGYRRHSSNVTKMRWGGIWFALMKRLIHVFALLTRVNAMIRYRKKLVHDGKLG